MNYEANSDYLFQFRNQMFKHFYLKLLLPQLLNVPSPHRVIRSSSSRQIPFQQHLCKHPPVHQSESHSIRLLFLFNFPSIIVPSSSPNTIYISYRIWYQFHRYGTPIKKKTLSHHPPHNRETVWLTHVSKSYFNHTYTWGLGGLTTVEIMDEVTIPLGDISSYDVLRL